MSNTDLNIGNDFNLNNLFRFTKSYTRGGSNMTTTNGTVTMNIYGTANDNSRHTIVPVWIYLL